MFVFAAVAVSVLLALVGGGFLGYKYGRLVESKAQAALSAVEERAWAVRSALKK